MTDWTLNKIAALREMANRLETSAAIARRVGINESRVHQMRVKLKLPRNLRARRPAPQPDFVPVRDVSPLDQGPGFPALDEAAAELRERMVALERRLVEAV